MKAKELIDKYLRHDEEDMESIDSRSTVSEADIIEQATREAIQRGLETDLDWQCPKCHKVNRRKAVYCGFCMTEKPDATQRTTPE